MQPPYTLDDLIKSRNGNSKLIKIESQSLKKADAQVAEAMGAGLLPSTIPDCQLQPYALIKYNQIATFEYQRRFRTS